MNSHGGGGAEMSRLRGTHERGRRRHRQGHRAASGNGDGDSREDTTAGTRSDARSQISTRAAKLPLATRAVKSPRRVADDDRGPPGGGVVGRAPRLRCSPWRFAVCCVAASLCLLQVSFFRLYRLHGGGNMAARSRGGPSPFFLRPPISRRASATWANGAREMDVVLAGGEGNEVGAEVTGQERNGTAGGSPLPFGFVMGEFYDRMLTSRMEGDSSSAEKHHVVVVSPSRARTPTANDTFGVGDTFLLRTAADGYHTHPIDPRGEPGGQPPRTLDEWWSLHGKSNRSKIDDEAATSSNPPFSSASSAPNVLLAVVDAGVGGEDRALSDSSAGTFLGGASPTYIILAVHADPANGTMGGLRSVLTLLDHRYKVQVLQVSHHLGVSEEQVQSEQWRRQWGPNSILTRDTAVDFFRWGGLAAAHHTDGGAEGGDAVGGGIFHAFLFATRTLDLAIPSRRLYVDEDAKGFLLGTWKYPTRIRPYVSCGHVAMVSFGDERLRPQRKELGGAQNQTNSTTPIPMEAFRVHCNFVDITDRLRGEDVLDLWFDNADHPHNDDPWEAEAVCVRIRCHHFVEMTKSAIERNARLNDTHVACATRHVARTPARPPSVKAHPEARVSGDSSTPPPNLLVIDLDQISRSHFRRSLPLLRAELERNKFIEFPNHAAVGDARHVDRPALYSGLLPADFSSAAEHKDGPSHLNGTGGAESDSSGDGVHPRWLWDRLEKAGYATMSLTDQCSEGSLDTTKPRGANGSSPGAAVERMLCQDFARPNCVGGDLAANHVLNYAGDFIRKRRDGRDGDGDGDGAPGGRPWGVLLTLVDGAEDSHMLAGVIDDALRSFFIGLELKTETMHRSLPNDLVMVVTSSGGLGYGAYQRSPSGQKERYEPVLYIRLPQSTPESELKVMRKNSKLWTTPLDVHETLLHAVLGIREAGGTSASRGSSLLTQLPDIRQSCQGVSTIPTVYCELREKFRVASLRPKNNFRKGQSCSIMPSPPSILSFFADIPRDHRTKWPECKEDLNYSPFPKSCLCATSHRDWHECNAHPWNSTNEEEYFALVDCEGRALTVEARVLRQQKFVDRYNALRHGVAPERRPRPQATNILFLEIDSVSVAYADRHFPKTRAVLKKYRIGEEPDGAACPSGLCSVEFSKFAPVGPNSIANQLGALSGCVASLFHERCFDHDKHFSKHCFCNQNGKYQDSSSKLCQSCPLGQMLRNATGHCETDIHNTDRCCSANFPGRNAHAICSDKNVYEYGLQLYKLGPRSLTTWCPAPREHAENNTSPWLFDIAKENGYLTFIGEEFCYEGSPYVTQDNVFPTNTDYNLHKVHCRMASREVNRTNLNMGKDELWKLSLKNRSPCTEGELGSNTQKLAFEEITQIWDAYPDVPKFAFLNSLAAHDYGTDWASMALAAEAYDDHLSSFLESMFEREDRHNTVVVVRGDHGLQGGHTMIDYSTQVEHSRPWTEMVVPRDLPGILIDAIVFNQAMLTTGFDLYRTLRSIMSPELREVSGSMAVPSIPLWSHDLLSSKVPEQRTCAKARIPSDFCPCDFQRQDVAPHFGTCNVFEGEQKDFCETSEKDEEVSTNKYRCKTERVFGVSGVKQTGVRTENKLAGIRTRKKLTKTQTTRSYRHINEKNISWSVWRDRIRKQGGFGSVGRVEKGAVPETTK